MINKPLLDHGAKSGRENRRYIQRRMRMDTDGAAAGNGDRGANIRYDDRVRLLLASTILFGCFVGVLHLLRMAQSYRGALYPVIFFVVFASYLEHHR